MNKNTLKTPKKNGFTLIEVMVTLSIAAILISIAVPSFTSLFRNNRVTAGTNEFVAALILARSEALKRNNNVSVCASSNQQTCSGTDFAKGWIVFTDCNQDGNIDDGSTSTVCGGSPEQIIKVHDKLKIKSIKSASGNKQFLNYTFSGRIRPADIGIINLTEDNHPGKDIIINMTGRVRTRTP